MALDPAFVADCPYGPEGIVIDDVVEVDTETGLVRATMPCHSDLPITRAQRVHPVRHPQHVSGGLMIHVTGVMGFVHAYYVLGLRHAEGWIGYGGRIYNARFHALAKMGPTLNLRCQATKVRKMSKQVFVRYEFVFEQEGELVYEGDQGAMWTKVEE